MTIDVVINSAAEGVQCHSLLPPGLDELWGGEELAWSLVRQ